MKKMSTWRFRSSLFLLTVFAALLIFSGCKKNGHQPPPATGSLQDEKGLCMPSAVHGIWYNGISAGTDTNYVEVSVNVTRAGSYRIATDRQNGVMFADDGNFTSTGPNRVRLKGTGTFISPIPTNFTVMFDTTACQFTVNVQDSAGLSIADNSWQFTAGGHVYQGPGFGQFFSLPADLGSTFSFIGSMAGFSDTSMFIDIALPQGALDTISYLTTTFGNDVYFTSSRFYTGGKARYSADYQSLPAVVDIHVRSFTGLVGPDIFRTTILCTFNGTARDLSNNIVPITNARFKIVNQ